MKSDITFKLYLMKRKMKKDGTIPIYLRITQNRKYRLLATGISIDEKNWNPEKSEIRKNHPRYKAFNTQLEHFVFEAKQALEALPVHERKAGAIKEVLKEKPADQNCFFEYADSFIDKLEAEKNFWGWKQTRVIIGKLRKYHSGNLQISDINKPLLEGFKTFLETEYNNGNSTIRKQFQRLKAVIKNAIDEGFISNDPFLGFKPIPNDKSDKARLSIEQIEAIKALELKPGSWLDITRDAFLFSFYNAGIRFGDIARLQWKHIIDGRLKYNMAKTGTGKNIKLLAPALEILARYSQLIFDIITIPAKNKPNAMVYTKTEPQKTTPAIILVNFITKKLSKNKDSFIFPILKPDDYSDEMHLKKQISSKNFMANKSLKKLAEMAGIQENISFHVSRHSFADYARTSGMNLYDISKALGHSDIQITQAYLKSFDETSLDSSMEALFNK